MIVLNGMSDAAAVSVVFARARASALDGIESSSRNPSSNRSSPVNPSAFSSASTAAANGAAPAPIIIASGAA